MFIFWIRNRLNSCTKNQLLFRDSISLRVTFQSKTHLPSLFRFKDSIFPKTSAHSLITIFPVVAAVQIIMINLRNTFLYKDKIIWGSLSDTETDSTGFYYGLMTFKFLSQKTMSLNYTLMSHYWIKEINLNSMETFKLIH